MSSYKLLFHSDYKEEILKAFGNKLDEEGFLINDRTSERILTKDSLNSEEIHINEFAGIAKGSRLYLKSDIVSLIQYIDKRK